ncbi:MAG: hypothetical protein KatS3mg059_1309 [Thermomicrobiales bacterium]|nr:MAG: hypothetical protein KatS3mg059_1309 [Thermomicrobiales bacterium]
MTRHDDLVYLGHMLDMARRAHELATRIGRDRYDADWTQQFTLIRSVEIIGEAVRRVSETGRERLPSVPWRQIVGTRNRIPTTKCTLTWS